MDIFPAPAIILVPNFTFAPSRLSNMSDTTDIIPVPQDRNVRSRIINGYGLIPYDTTVRFPEGMVEVDIEHMMSDNPECKKGIMYLQLIRIVSGSNNGQNNSSVFQSYYKKNKKENSLSSQYYRLLLFRDISCKKGQVVYIVEGRHVNDHLWLRYPLLRDNGVVTIGTYIAIINPLPITTMFCNEIPMIECHGGCFVMKDPTAMSEIDVDMSITNNLTRSFLKNNMDVDVKYTNVHSTQCSGQLCDKQRAVEISRGNRACGCYHMHTRVGNLTLVHKICVSKGGNELLAMDDFSSSKFSNIFLKEPFSSTVKFNLLDLTPAFFKMQTCIDEVTKYINDNGGFTVSGWYKRGEINDISNEDSQNQVESSEIGYHIVCIHPTNSSIILRSAFNSLKFDMSE